MFTKTLIKNDDIKKIKKKIYNSPYIVELKEGILDKELFLRFKEQDYQFLHEYKYFWELLAKKYEKYSVFFKKQAYEIEEEIKTLKIENSEDLIQSPFNLLYTSFVKSIIMDKSLIESLTVMLACPWIYYKVATNCKKLLKHERYKNIDKYYFEWLDEYSSKEFKENIDELFKIINDLSENSSNEEKSNCIKYFKMVCEMEFHFWDSVYHVKNWSFINKKYIKPTCALTIAGSDSGGNFHFKIKEELVFKQI
jgi:thiaminase